MVSLECIFYMTDCHYKQLEKRDQHQKVDRIGSENYKLTKDGDIGLANFEQDPTSLQANKFEPYLSKKVMNIAVKAPAWGGLVKEIQKKIRVPKRDLMRTKNNEAFVECYLTKWRIDEKGSLMRLTQSKSFKLQGDFKPHKNGQFELKISEDGKQIFIANEFLSLDGEKRVEIKIWNSSDLQEKIWNSSNLSQRLQLKEVKQFMRVKMMKPIDSSLDSVATQESKNKEKEKQKHQKIKTTKNEEQKLESDELIKNERILWRDTKYHFEDLFIVGCHQTKYIHNIQILNDGEYWAFYLRNKTVDSKDTNSLEHVIVFKVNGVQLQCVYQFDSTNNRYKQGPASQLGENYELVSSIINTPESEYILHLQPLKVHLEMSMYDSVQIKIIYVIKLKSNLVFQCKNSTGQKVEGYPWFIVNRDIENIDSDEKNAIHQLNNINEITKSEKRDTDGTLFNLMCSTTTGGDQSALDNKKQDKVQDILDRNPSLYNKIFVFDKEQFNDSNFLKLEVSFSKNQEYISFISNSGKQNLFVTYSKDFCKKYWTFASMGFNKSKNPIEFVRGQSQKTREMYCVTKGRNNEINIFAFDMNDKSSMKKIITVQGLHVNTKIDCYQFETKFQREIFVKSKNPDSGPQRQMIDDVKKKIGVLSLLRNSQQLNVTFFSPMKGKYEMKQLQNRSPPSQQTNAQYPCLATNLGMQKMAIHVNKNQRDPECLILDFQEILPQVNKEEADTGDREEQEQFMGFLDVHDLKSIGFDDSFLSIGTCSKFVYLTSSINRVHGDNSKDFLTIWLNILLVDSFNRIPQVTHFKSSSIFKITFEKNKNSLDLLQQARMYHNGEEYFLLLQFPRQIFRKKLNPDTRMEERAKRIEEEKKRLKKEQEIAERKIQREKDRLEKIRKAEEAMAAEEAKATETAQEENKEDPQAENKQDGQNLDGSEVKPEQTTENERKLDVPIDPEEAMNEEPHDDELEEEEEEENQAEEAGQDSGSSSDDGNKDEHDDFYARKKMTLKFMLLGFMVPVAMIADKQNIYFVTTNDETLNLLNKDFKIEIKQFNIKSENVTTLFTIRQQKMIGFKQLVDGRFIIIDHDGEVNIFVKSKNGQKLLRQGAFFMHDYDLSYMVNTVKDYQDILIDDQTIIVGSKICFLHQRQADIVEGVLESQDLKSIVKSDYDHKLVKGPILYNGQQQFIQVFVYNDSDNNDYFQFRQKVFNHPTSNRVNLLDDFKYSCQLSTFLSEKQILAQFGHRFFQFDENGRPIDEIEFSQREENGADMDKRNYLVIYWHQYMLDNDHSGVNKIIHIPNEKENQDTNQDEYIAQQMVERLGEKLNTSKENIPYAVVRINKTEGLQIIDHSDFQASQGIFTQQVKLCIEQAKKEYFSRYELVTISEDCNYFLFFDNYLQKFQLWERRDQSTSIVKSFLARKKLGDECEDQIKVATFIKKEKAADEAPQTYDDSQISNDKSKTQKLKEKEYIQYYQFDQQFQQEYLTKCKMSENVTKEIKEQVIHADDDMDQYMEPECEKSPHKFRPIDQKRYIRKFLEQINLKDIGVEIEKNGDDEQYSIHKLSNLLNNYKTKFRCEITNNFVKKVHSTTKKGDESKQMEARDSTIDIYADKNGLAETKAENFTKNEKQSDPDSEEEFESKVDNLDFTKSDCAIITLKMREPQQISAFGIQSANNNPQMDPTRVQIFVRYQTRKDNWILKPEAKDKKQDELTEDDYQNEEVQESRVALLLDQKFSKVNQRFKNRFQEKKFLSPMPNLMVQEVIIRLYNRDLENKNKFYQENEGNQYEVTCEKTAKIQLSQIMLFKRKQKFDYSFVRSMILNFWKVENDHGQNRLILLNGEKDMVIKDPKFGQLNILKQLYQNSKGEDYQIVIQKFIQFLRQQNVTKKIRVENDETDKCTVSVIIAYCDQDTNQAKIETSINSLKGISSKKEREKITEAMHLEGQIYTVGEDQFKHFKLEFQVAMEKYVEGQLRIKNEIQRQMKKNDLFRLKQQQLPPDRRNYKRIQYLQHALRKQIFELSLMIQVKFGNKWVVIQESQRIQKIQYIALIKAKQQEIQKQFWFIDKKEEASEKFESKISDIPDFTLPSKGQQILNIHFIKQKEARFENVIQIQAYDFSNQVLIAATWDLENDNEVSMYQLKCPHKHPETLFLYGICSKPYYRPEEYEDEDDEEDIAQKKHMMQGDSGYLLQGDMIIDLKNNIPVIFCNSSKKEVPEYLNAQISQASQNLKKMYNDSTRFLSSVEPQSLVFDHSMKDTSYWNDVTSSENPLELLDQNPDLLGLFRKKFDGQSLFHNFASKYDDKQLDQLVALIYTKYTKAQEDETISEVSIKNMPLFILGLDDVDRYSALQIAIKSKKPITFEMMVGMLKNFDDICSSKMMLGNFTSLMNHQALEYFDKAQFNPPLLQVTFPIDWPEEIDEIVFTCETSLLTQSTLTKKIKERMKFKGSEIAKLFVWLDENTKTEVDTNFQDNKKDKKRCKCGCFCCLKGFFKGVLCIPICIIDLFNFIMEKTTTCITESKCFKSCKECCSSKKKKQKKRAEHKLRNEEEDGGGRQQVTVSVQALDFDWIFEGNNAEQFIHLLNDNESGQIYDQYSIKVFVEFLWEYYRREIKKWEFIPFVCKLLCIILLSSNKDWSYLNQMKTLYDPTTENEQEPFVEAEVFAKIDINDKKWVVLQERPEKEAGLIIYQIVFSLLSLIFIAQYLVREVVELRNEGWRTYFSSIWNIWGLFTEAYSVIYVVSLLYLLKFRETGVTLETVRFFRQISGWAIMMLWLKLFYWASLWDGPAYFIIQFEKTAESVTGFITMYSVMILAFANFFFIIQMNLPEGGWYDPEDDNKQKNYVEQSIGIPAMDAVISMYLASLGEFNSGDGYVGGYNVKSAWMMFLLATVLLPLLFLNMLIAVMSEPFEEVKENKDALILKKKIEFIVTYIDLIDLQEKFKKDKYIMVVRPEDNEKEAEDDDNQIFQQALQKNNEIYRHQMLLRDDILERLGTIERNMYQPDEIEPPAKEEPVKQVKAAPKVEPSLKQQLQARAPQSLVKNVLKPKEDGAKMFENPVVRQQVINSIYLQPLAQTLKNQKSQYPDKTPPRAFAQFIDDPTPTPQSQQKSSQKAGKNSVKSKSSLKKNLNKKSP